MCFKSTFAVTEDTDAGTSETLKEEVILQYNIIN